jgi:hypothetical protein
MEKSMTSVVVAEIAGGGRRCSVGSLCSRTTWRLRKRSRAGTGEGGERGVLGRGNVSPEVILLGGNKGGKIDKNGGGRLEDRGE